MNKLTLTERYARMWKKSRNNIGKSQSYMAKALGVSKKTVQNWEEGLSIPKQIQGLEWFEVLGVHPLPYYIEMLYDFDTSNMNNMDAKQIQDTLIEVIKVFPASEQSKLLYCLSGKHGSNPICLINLLLAHTMTSLRDRINIAQSICTNYEIANNLNAIPTDCNVSPDMEILKTAIDAGKCAVSKGKKSYSAMIDGLEVSI